MEINKRNLPSYLPVCSYQDRYQPFSYLGNGSFGSVLLARYRGENMKTLIEKHESKLGTMMYPLNDCQGNHTNLVAIKTMTKKLPVVSDYCRVKELRFILNVSSHPCLVQIYEVFIDDVKYQLHIAMESMNQNLHQLMKARRNVHFSPVTLKSILSQILCGIRHIHKHNYFHRDVKPENILIIPTTQYYGKKENVPPHRYNDNYIVKLADYGLARHIHNLRPFTDYVSTRWYRPPEILLKNSWYAKPIDIWAYGLVCAEVVNFYPLFPGSDEIDQLNKILKVLGCPLSSRESLDKLSVPLGGYWRDAENLSARLGFVFPSETGCEIDDILPDSIPKDLRSMIKSCLTWNPQIRPTVDTLCDCSYFDNTIITYEETVYHDAFKQPPTNLPLAPGRIISPISHTNSISPTVISNISSNSGTRPTIYDDEIDDGYNYIYDVNKQPHDCETTEEEDNNEEISIDITSENDNRYESMYTANSKGGIDEIYELLENCENDSTPRGVYQIGSVEDYGNVSFDSLYGINVK